MITAKLPRHLHNSIPFEVGEYFIWAKSLHDAQIIAGEIELRQRPNDELVSGWFHYMDENLATDTAYYVRKYEYGNPLVWEDI